MYISLAALIFLVDILATKKGERLNRLGTQAIFICFMSLIALLIIAITGD